MKPFDLEAFKQGEVGITRAGEEVTFVAHVPEALEEYRLAVLDKNGFVRTVAENGNYVLSNDCSLDIVGLKPKTKTYWINMYEGSCYGYDSQEKADSTMSQRRINGKAYKVEIEL